MTSFDQDALGQSSKEGCWLANHVRRAAERSEATARRIADIPALTQRGNGDGTKQRHGGKERRDARTQRSFVFYVNSYDHLIWSILFSNRMLNTECWFKWAFISRIK